jgi:hypothetical protein
VEELKLPDPSTLEPIENHLWTPEGAPPEEAIAVVRGSPITATKFFEHALRQARRYSYRGGNMASLSVNLVLPDWPEERILEERLPTYPRWAQCRTDALAAADFTLLATGSRPHADVLFPTLGILLAERLEALFRLSEQRNAFQRR